MNKRTRKKWLKKQGLYIDPRETWDLDVRISEYVIPRLKLYKKLTKCYPGIGEANTPEKWDDLLDKMIWSFEQVIYENQYGIFEDRGEKEWKEINDKINEGLELFGKWFRHLGW